jgi:hypothetical protein
MREDSSFNFLLNDVPVFQGQQVIFDIEDYLRGDFKTKEYFSKKLAEELSQKGFTHIKHPKKFLGDNNSNFSYKELRIIYNKYLKEKNSSRGKSSVQTVFETGYYSTYFPDSENIKQRIESFLVKPEMWIEIHSPSIALSIAVRRLLYITHKAYTACHLVSDILLEALEYEYKIETGGLRKFFKLRSDGAMRCVKYHKPILKDLNGTNKLIQASEPHIDKSFFSFNFGESSIGLVWINGTEWQLLPNKPGHWLITTGLYAQGVNHRFGHSGRTASLLSKVQSIWNRASRCIVQVNYTANGQRWPKR